MMQVLGGVSQRFGVLPFWFCKKRVLAGFGDDLSAIGVWVWDGLAGFFLVAGTYALYCRRLQPTVNGCDPH